MIGRLVERLKKLRDKQAEEPEYEPDCVDCPDYDDCTNPLICIATIDDY